MFYRVNPPIYGGAKWRRGADAAFSLPLADLGAGAVDTAPARGTGAATFTRATTAWTKLASGLWAQVASGTARSCYIGANTTVGVYGGYLAEPARTNLCLQSRDLSNASWTKLNATAVKDQTGIDGVANSASSLTATAGGGSCLQTITEAATASALSLFLKRITGTGTVTIQQGATTSEVSAQINSATYTRIELDATVLNPAIGIVLGTNGDKLAVDMVQFENGVGATSPIPTTTVAVTRNADILSYPTAGNLIGATGNAYAEITSGAAAGQQTAIIETTAGGGYPMIMSSGNALAVYDVTAVRGLNALVRPIAAVTKVATSWGGVNCTGFLSGVASTPGTFDGDMNPGVAIFIGGNGAGTENPIGTIKNIRLSTKALSDAQNVAMTT